MCTQSEQDKPTTQAEASANVSAKKPVKVDGEIFTVVEQQPEFPGGMKELGSYMQNNLKYPAAAEKANVQGRVFVNFIVTKTGEITDVRVLKDVGFGTGEEAVRVVGKMPRWEPGRQGTEPVNVRYNLPINFQLDSESEPTGYLKDIKTVVLNGKEVTKEEFQKIPTESIIRVDVDKENSTIKVTTK
ncbi:energy transducer TonB [Spirosoma rhododendri]|uniref:Energy transducer TonB n=1 Tax=Spirosoma rhododendri TaxID=2728024 RepID=A0A7L5DMJ3_9BACT|nr:energy transducer TonB [Spirosoma rhododendri]QJD78433.1 energy transducer TonB [Spirosoma rhododendri]